MIYFSYFKDNNNNQYTLALHTNYLNKDKDKMVYVRDMGVSISSQMESDELYKSYKCSHFQFSFYTDNPIEIVKDFGFLNTYVVLYKEDKKTKRNILQFQGYVTNNSFNSNYAYNKEFLNLQAQDPLSTLKYKKYKRVNADSNLVEIKDILFSMLSSLGVYNDVYITNSLYVPSGQELNVLEQIKVQEDSFFNEDNEPYTCMEVLEQIMKMLNLSIVPVGDQIYILSYDSIRSGYDTYLHYFFDSTDPINRIDGIGYVVINYPNRRGQWFRNGEVSLNHILRLQGKHFASNDTQISITAPTTKYIITSDIYPYNKLLPDLNNLVHYYQTKEYDNLGKIRTSTIDLTNEKYHNYIIEDGRGNRYNKETKTTSNDGNNENITVLDVNDITENGNIIPHKFYLRTLLFNNINTLNTNIRTFCYKKSGNTFVEDNVPIETLRLTQNILMNRIITLPVQTQVVNLKNNENHTISFKGVKWLFSVWGYDRILKYGSLPMMEVKIKQVPITKDNHIVFNGKWEAYNNPLHLPIRENRTEKIDERLMYIPTEIKLGKLYWNSDTNTWVGEKVKCKLPLEFNEGSNAYGVIFPFKNNITFNSFLGETRGLSVPLTNSFYNPSDIDFQDLTITFFNIQTHHGISELTSVKIWELSDFNVEIVTKDSEQRYIPIKQEHNIEYENTIEGEDFEEKTIELKFNTNVGNGFNKSDLYYRDGEQNKRLKHLLNKSNGELLQVEHHILNNYLNQYETPSVHLTTTLNNIEEIKPYSLIDYKPYINDYMVVNKIQHDYYRDTQTIELIEKYNNAHKI